MLNVMNLKPVQLRKGSVGGEYWGFRDTGVTNNRERLHPNNFTLANTRETLVLRALSGQLTKLRSEKSWTLVARLAEVSQI